LAKEKPLLAAAADFLREALPGLYAEPIQSSAPTMTGEKAHAKLEGGVPLLRGESLPLDTDAFARRWQHVCSAVLGRLPSPPLRGSAGGGGMGGEGASAVAEVLRTGLLDPRRLMEDTLAGRPEAIHARADELGLDAGLTATVLRLTLLPVLSQVASDWVSFRAGCRWEHGYCPICGSWPLLGEFRGLEQTRFLRCGLCAAGWEYARLCCPFCETTDHRQLGYFYVEGEEGKYRVSTCAGCRGYVKMISSFSEFSPAKLLVIDAATVHLDLAAAERGYEQNPACNAPEILERK
jgi:FdhE protein